MNPLILRGIRERLRTKQLIASGLFSLILCSTIYLSLYLYGASDEKIYDRETKPTNWSKAFQPTEPARHSPSY